MFEFLRQLTPDFFNTIIIVVIIIGSALAIVRLVQDLVLPPRVRRPATPPPQPERENHD